MMPAMMALMIAIMPAMMALMEDMIAMAMAVMIALSTKLSDQKSYGVEGVSASLLSILVVMALVGVCYRYSGVIFNRLGHTGTNVVSRLSAFLLLSIGVSIIWEGILGLIHSMPH